MCGPAFTLCHAFVNANLFRLYITAIAGVLATGQLRAQSPASAPLILRFSAGTRATSLGGAWVAGRDEDVVFYNPAQIVARTGFNLSLARYGSTATQASMASGYAAGPWSLALGWGIQFADLHSPPDYVYPLSPELVFAGGPVDIMTMQATVGASILLKGFRIGVAGKYATDRASAPSFDAPNEQRREVWLADFGLARPIFSGTAALAVQNVGGKVANGAQEVDAPLQAALGWASNPKTLGEFDLGLYGQVAARTGWISPAAGAELNYGWIEGFGISFRAGARRPEMETEKPFTLGAAFTGDHLIVEYAHQFFDGGHHANRMTIRWR